MRSTTGKSKANAIDDIRDTINNSRAMIIQITAPHFCAGIDTETGVFAPILSYMQGWTFDQIQRYCKTKGWLLHLLYVDLR